MTSAPSSSRLAPARRRAHVVKLASVGAAAVGFGVVAMLARGAHPGAAGNGSAGGTTSGLDVSSRISQEAEQSGDFFSSGSVTPSQSSSPPQASTHTS
jgi:hypothetical protein